MAKACSTAQITLAVLALYLIYEETLRLFAPEPIDGWLVVRIAALALAVDLVTAALTWSMSRDSMNIRAAFLHNLADALGSVAVIVAGTLVILLHWVWVDPVVTLMIAGIILWHLWVEVGDVIRMLMLGGPPQIDAQAVARAIEMLPDVQNVHHLRLCSMQEHQPALDAHLVIWRDASGRADAVKARVRTMLADNYGIRHSTLDIECSLHACLDATRIDCY